MPPVRELLPDWQECADKFCHKNPAAKLDILTTGTHADMYRNNRHVGQVITYTPRSFTWLGFPRLELCDQILGNSYDLIVDCHRPPDLLVAYLVGLCQKAFRVGLQADQSHLFYNVSVAPQGERYLDLVCKTVMLF
jgi:ADP-heptose:LPS heptosyltransferase